jgi:hypothetical protein
MTRASFTAAISLCLGLAIAPAAAQPAGPPGDYRINADYTATSPDKKTTIDHNKKALVPEKE